MTESISPLSIRALQTAPIETREPKARDGERFETLLDRAVRESRGVKFSAHARTRLAGRGIELTEADRRRIERGAEMARAKGSRDALLVMDHIGFI